MEEEEVFEDALDEVEAGEEAVEDGGEMISLAIGLRDAQEAIDHFFNNNYEEARRVSEKYCDRSIYHALGKGTFNYLMAVMTFEQENLQRASEILSQSIAVIDKYRRKTGFGESLGKMIKKQDYDSYSEVEVHAELVFAECLLFKAMLTICEDETLVSFVKAGLKVRQCYLAMKECANIVHHRDFSRDEHKTDFVCGVSVAVGTFNLLVSLLPARVTKLLEFVGFTATRDIGLRELLSVQREEACLRHFASSLILLAYHLFLTTNIGKPSDCDISLVEDILEKKLRKYPKGAFFLFFKGRAELVSGRCESATKWYSLANNSQVSWPQFQHVGCWELFWSACFRCLWEDALVQADRLLRESRWSPCLYSYMKAVIYCQIQNLTEEQRQEKIELMESLPRLKQRIAGKSLPMEKFTIKKAEKFKLQNNSLVLPGLEMVYLWHGFSVIGPKYHLVETLFILIEDTTKQLSAKGKLDVEDDCLLQLLRGMCLKHMSSPLQAEECFRSVMSRSSQLTLDKYLGPYATFELAQLLLEQGDMAQAKEYLNKAKSQKDYCLQNRLHFRIHAAQSRFIDNDAKEDAGEKRRGEEETFSKNFTNHTTDINPQI